MTKTRSHGFTLIELSLVLVIIGLLVAGVLAGKELIKGAEIRKVVSEIDKINVATIAFKQKYNALPADISQAHAINFGIPLPTGATHPSVGNEDGGINGAAPNNVEISFFWHHLKWAGYVSCQCAVYPP